MKGAARRGFNAILACDSIKSAESYYRVLHEMIGQRERCDLKVATIFSFAPNAPEDPCGFIDDEELECDGMPQVDRDFLDGAIANYNAMFSTSFSTDAQGFDGYYKDVSRRMKGEDVDGKPLPQGECLDLLIVVDMFLTGFDAKTLNTLWVDKMCIRDRCRSVPRSSTSRTSWASTSWAARTSTTDVYKRQVRIGRARG